MFASLGFMDEKREKRPLRRNTSTFLNLESSKFEAQSSLVKRGGTQIHGVQTYTIVAVPDDRVLIISISMLLIVSHLFTHLFANILYCETLRFICLHFQKDCS